MFLSLLLTVQSYGVNSDAFRCACESHGSTFFSFLLHIQFFFFSTGELQAAKALLAQMKYFASIEDKVKEKLLELM